MHSRAGGGSQGRPEGGEMAELWPCSPGGSPRARRRQRDGGKTVSYLSTIRSRCRFFCLSWLFLLACNLRLAWLLSSWAVRAPVVTERQNYQQDSNRLDPVTCG